MPTRSHELAPPWVIDNGAIMARGHDAENRFDRQHDTEEVSSLVGAFEPPECCVVVAERLLHDRDGARREPAVLASLE